MFYFFTLFLWSATTIFSAQPYNIPQPYNTPQTYGYAQPPYKALQQQPLYGSQGKTQPYPVQPQHAYPQQAYQPYYSQTPPQHSATHTMDKTNKMPHPARDTVRRKVSESIADTAEGAYGVRINPDYIDRKIQQGARNLRQKDAYGVTRGAKVASRITENVTGHAIDPEYIDQMARKGRKAVAAAREAVREPEAYDVNEDSYEEDQREEYPPYDDDAQRNMPYNNAYEYR